MANDLIISAEAGKRIFALLDSGNRTAAYLLAGDITGRAAFYQTAQISSFSGFLGGVALAQNISIRNNRIGDTGGSEATAYHPGGIIGFSRDVAVGVLRGSIRPIRENGVIVGWRVRDNRAIFQEAQNVWHRFGLKEYFPGNPYLGQPATAGAFYGYGGVESVQAANLGSRSNDFQYDLFERMRQYSNGSVTSNIHGTYIYVNNNEGKAKGAYNIYDAARVLVRSGHLKHPNLQKNEDGTLRLTAETTGIEFVDGAIRQLNSSFSLGGMDSLLVGITDFSIPRKERGQVLHCHI